jgi:hypothetical protein
MQLDDEIKKYPIEDPHAVAREDAPVVDDAAALANQFEDEGADESEDVIEEREALALKLYGL